MCRTNKIKLFSLSRNDEDFDNAFFSHPSA